MPSFGDLVNTMERRITLLEDKVDLEERKYNQLIILLKAMVDRAYNRRGGRDTIKWVQVCQSLEKFLETQLPNERRGVPADLIAEMIKNKSKKF